MYSVLNLDLPALSRMNQLHDFFFYHIQMPTQSDETKKQILQIYYLIAKSDPSRYGNPKDGQTIVQYA
jgi:hypothetical protein